MFGSISDYSKDNVLAHTIDVVEGGSVYTNDKDDNGGECRYGVTKKTALVFKSQWPRFSWDGDMRTMPREFALLVCKSMFWDNLRLDHIEKICPITSAVAFDIAYNMGTSRVGKWIQEILNANNNMGTLYPDISVDGAVGFKTLNALDMFYAKRGIDGISNLTYALTAFQTRKYYSIVSKNERQEKWLYGWSDRAGNSIESYLPIFLKMKGLI